MKVLVIHEDVGVANIFLENGQFAFTGRDLDIDRIYLMADPSVYVDAEEESWWEIVDAYGLIGEESTKDYSNQRNVNLDVIRDIVLIVIGRSISFMLGNTF